MLWFELSNQYIVISDTIMNVLEIYFDSGSCKEFLRQLQTDLDIPPQKAENYYNEITELLIASNQDSGSEIPNHNLPEIPEGGIKEMYCFGDISIKITFGSERIKELIHPQWAHTTIHQTEATSIDFHIFNDEHNLYLIKDDFYFGHYLLSDYHLLQGQFALQIVNVLHKKNEADWIATFHASTVCNDKEAIMLIGDSGNGKSTLSAVLMANGFDVLADDFTPLATKNSEIYRFPSGISVKEGAFNIMRPLFPNFNQFPLYVSSSKHVNIKYIPPVIKLEEGNAHFPCNKIVVVKYDAQAKSELKAVDSFKVLSTLITESWLSPLASNSKLFLEWLKDMQCFELNYSDNAIAVSKFKELFTSN